MARPIDHSHADLADPMVLAVAIVVNDDPTFGVVVMNDHHTVEDARVLALATLVARLTESP